MKHRVLYTLALLFAAAQLFAQTKVRYTYDSLNRLTKVICSDGTTVEYTYDALGNRLSKKVSKKAPIRKGDVNEDGAVDIADVVAVYNIMAGMNPNSYDGDVNKDGATDIADVVAVYNIMAGGQ